ncbi:hypothetical protein [Nocardioides zeae]|uniref:PASTA domain-containing protein n=1 Tax=Nocardioides zeae TaxID=1457234 RepID=A0A6P0HEC1_9ACTN|nr:hypothetical protein [Nocardioides zeae]NEN76667.1 hypothetical protein [Nocardioides zeae]
MPQVRRGLVVAALLLLVGLLGACRAADDGDPQTAARPAGPAVPDADEATVSGVVPEGWQRVTNGLWAVALPGEPTCEGAGQIDAGFLQWPEGEGPPPLPSGFVPVRCTVSGDGETHGTTGVALTDHWEVVHLAGERLTVAGRELVAGRVQCRRVTGGSYCARPLAEVGSQLQALVHASAVTETAARARVAAVLDTFGELGDGLAHVEVPPAVVGEGAAQAAARIDSALRETGLRPTVRTVPFESRHVRPGGTLQTSLQPGVVLEPGAPVAVWIASEPRSPGDRVEFRVLHGSGPAASSRIDLVVDPVVRIRVGERLRIATGYMAQLLGPTTLGTLDADLPSGVLRPTPISAEEPDVRLAWVAERPGRVDVPLTVVVDGTTYAVRTFTVVVEQP